MKVTRRNKKSHKIHQVRFLLVVLLGNTSEPIADETTKRVTSKESKACLYKEVRRKETEKELLLQCSSTISWDRALREVIIGDIYIAAHRDEVLY